MNPQLALILTTVLGNMVCPAVPELEEMAKKTESKIDDNLVNILKVICILTGHGELFDVIKK